jgi:NTE family protein
VREIADRRNALSGNLSLGQELYFIDRINHLLVEHTTLRAKYKPITIRVVELGFDRPRLSLEARSQRGPH